jgi:Glycosyl transferase family 2
MMTPITIAIVNYNTREHLRACLATVQMERPLEVVVVDNASTDDSAEMVRVHYPSIILRANERKLGYRLGKSVLGVQGIITGLMAGLGILIATNWLVLKGGEVVGPHLALLGQFFIGYRVTFGGSLIGAAYGFVCGFVVGGLVATMYNWLVNLRERRGQSRA